MAWIEIIEDENVKFYSVSSAIEVFHDNFLSLWSPAMAGFIVLMVTLFAMLIGGYILRSIYLGIKKGDIV
jgi:hypothetical protein